MARLSDIDPSELSLVARGANRRRFSVRKSHDVLPEIADVLELPAYADEPALIACLEKADVDEGAGLAALGAYRLLRAYGDELPAPLQRLVKRLDLELLDPDAMAKPVRKAAALPKPATRETVAEADARRHAEWVALAKADRVENDRAAEADLTRKAEAIRKAAGFERGDFALTKEQALVKAYEENPDLYMRSRRDQLRREGVDVDQDLDGTPPAVPVALEKAADGLQAVDNSLTREQAYLKACEIDPSLYELWGQS